MAVTGVCPSCQAKFPLPAALQDARARQALHEALRIAPALADRVVAYLELFSPGDRRAIRMDRLALLLEELAEPIRAGELARGGRVLPAPVECWAESLDVVLCARDRLTLPLKSHGYLFEVAARLADRHAARQEREREAALRHRGDPQRQEAGPVPVSDGATLPRSIREALDRCSTRERGGGDAA